MKTETCLEIQAFVDGELDAPRRAAVEHLCATNLAARQLADQLVALREAVRSGEPEFQVPETREFYWSQIQRRMAASQHRAAVESTPGIAWTRWIRWIAPVAGAAAIISLLTLPERDRPAAATLATLAPRTSAKADLASASLIVYRSESDGVTVHWID